MTAKFKGGFVCGIKTWYSSSGEAWTQCGNKHFGVSNVGYGTPKCKACLREMARLEPEKKAEEQRAMAGLCRERS